MMDFSDYVVYVDESGDHGLNGIDPEFPVFALALCIVSKAEYSAVVVPAIQEFKFKYWGHDMVVLHENEIRKQAGDFAFLITDRVLRDRFLADLNSIMEAAPIWIVASVIDKRKLRNQYATSWNPYKIALHFCLESLFDFLIDKGQEGRTVHVVFECRNRENDRELELEFRRICDQEHHWGNQRRDFSRIDFKPRFARKPVNSTGLQLADLTARPIALQTLRPTQPNRAFDIIQPKLKAFKVFP